MNESVTKFIDFIRSRDGIGNKNFLIKEVQEKFGLVRDRSVYYSEHFSVRFSFSSSGNFSNTIISLSNLQKYDDLLFIVCLVTPKNNILFLANTTFLKKISHSSQELRIDNIKGSLNGSDIIKTFNGIENEPANFEKLFNIHAQVCFNGNIERLVEATNNISPSGEKFNPTNKNKTNIIKSIDRAIDFACSDDYRKLKKELDSRVKRYESEILIASFIENVNIRGRIIEYLITGESDGLREKLVEALHDKNQKIPSFRTRNGLGDYERFFEKYYTSTDVKTKIMTLSSNPKGYNIDKLLEFLSKEKSVYMLYFIGIEPNRVVNKVLVSVFQEDLLETTIVLKHWSGRHSKGVTQFEGSTIQKLILKPNNIINKAQCDIFIKSLIDL